MRHADDRSDAGGCLFNFEAVIRFQFARNLGGMLGQQGDGDDAIESMVVKIGRPVLSNSFRSGRFIHSINSR